MHRNSKKHADWSEARPRPETALAKSQRTRIPRRRPKTVTAKATRRIARKPKTSCSWRRARRKRPRKRTAVSWLDIVRGRTDRKNSLQRPNSWSRDAASKIIRREEPEPPRSWSRGRSIARLQLHPRGPARICRGVRWATTRRRRLMECGIATAPWRALTRTKDASWSGSDPSRRAPSCLWFRDRTTGVPEGIGSAPGFCGGEESTEDRPRCLGCMWVQILNQLTSALAFAFAILCCFRVIRRIMSSSGFPKKSYFINILHLTQVYNVIVVC